MNRLFGLTHGDSHTGESLRSRAQSAVLAVVGVVALICQALFLGVLAAFAVDLLFAGVNFGNWLLFFTLVFLVLIVFVFHSLATAPRALDE